MGETGKSASGTLKTVRMVADYSKGSSEDHRTRDAGVESTLDKVAQ